MTLIKGRLKSVKNLKLIVIAASLMILSFAWAQRSAAVPFISSSQGTFRVLGQPGDQKLQANIGKPTLVVFWAAWCIPCLYEVPHLNHLQATYGTAGLKILAMNIDEGSDAGIKHMVKKFEMIYPVARPSSQLVRDFGVQAIPAAFLYAPDGSLAQSWLGPVTAKEVEKHLAKWLPKPKSPKYET